MGVEYYIVKPSKQEVFYLGKHIEPIDCMSVSASTANYLNVDCFQDFLLQVIDSNDGFLDEEYSYREIKNFVYLLYEWCDDRVYLSSDCSSDWELFKDYKETGSIINFCEKHKPLIDRIINLLDNDCSVVEIEGCIDAYISDQERI